MWSELSPLSTKKIQDQNNGRRGMGRASAGDACSRDQLLTPGSIVKSQCKNAIKCKDRSPNDMCVKYNHYHCEQSLSLAFS